MDMNQFWQIIAHSRLGDTDRTDEWGERLQAELVRHPPDQIIEWNHLFDRLAAQAYTTDLVAACCLINTGTGDDGFYYFRCWLIGMGQAVYEATLANADSLASVVFPWEDAEAEIYAAAHNAWLTVTGEPETAHYPARNEHAELVGEDWDIDDRDEVRRRLPRLTALYQDAD